MAQTNQNNSASFPGSSHVFTPASVDTKDKGVSQWRRGLGVRRGDFGREGQCQRFGSVCVSQAVVLPMNQ